MYLLRPLGALFFGYLGDRYGRKVVVVLTTTLMSFCSFIIATLPSYDSIGITASIILISCRLLQGFSATGELAGAKVYLCEIALPPKNYFYTALVTVSSSLGGFFSLLMANYFMLLYPEDGWRYLFFFGSGIAVIGLFTRTYLKETPEFLAEDFKPIAKDKNRQSARAFSWKMLTNRYFIGYLSADCLGLLGFYVFYIYCGNILKNTYHLTLINILNHNVLLAGCFFIYTLLLSLLTLKCNPLRIVKVRCLLLIIALPFLPSLLQGATIKQFFLIQLVYGVLCEGCFPAHALFMKAFSTLQRLTTVSFVFGLSRIIVCLITTYVCWWFEQCFGILGIMLLILVNALIAFLGLSVFAPVEPAKSTTDR